MTIPEIDAETAIGYWKEGCALFLDMRDADSFEAAHIPDAVHLTGENVQTIITETDKTRRIVVYCYHGNMSRGGTAFLMEQGFEDVASLSGGFEVWQQNQPQS